MGHPRLSGLFAVARALAGLVLVYAGVSAWGIVGAAWAHLAASLLFTFAFVVVVHGRTVPTRLARLCAHGYLPGFTAAAAVALLAGMAERWFDRGSLDFALIASLTTAMLAILGLVFVVERDDRRWAWARVKALAGG